MRQETMTAPKLRRIKRLISACVLLGVLAALAAWYVNDYYRADAEAAKYLLGGDGVTVTETEEGWFFDGPGDGVALIFYPGAKVECTAYAPLMHGLAGRGVDCFLVEMPMNLAIFGTNRAGSVMEEYSYNRWYLAGHSLGGAMAASYASGHLEQLDGVILLAAYPTGSLQGEDFAVLSVYGSEDQVLNRDKLEAGRAYMPEDYTEVCIQGGNHAWFGSYGEQKGDGEALISREAQWEQTLDAVVMLIGG